MQGFRTNYFLNKNEKIKKSKNFPPKSKSQERIIFWIQIKKFKYFVQKCEALERIIFWMKMEKVENPNKLSKNASL